MRCWIPVALLAFGSVAGQPAPAGEPIATDSVIAPAIPPAEQPAGAIVADPPGSVTAQDYPNDAGDHLSVCFSPSPDEEGILSYRVYRRAAGDTDWVLVEAIAVGEGTSFVDGYDPDFPIESGVRYEYMIAALYVDGTEISGPVSVASETAGGEWYHLQKTRNLVACVLFIGLIFYYFQRARRGASLYLRPIAGIEAIDEAIGRATEMGKPILYVPGLSTISDVATIASLTILSRVARKVAEYQTPLLVPNRDPIVYTVAEECVKQAYLEAGRPDSYDQDSVFYLTDSQFAFVAAVNGIMARDKPATNFYLGMFWAESLILAETGSLSGAIQIAGTDAVTQLPFFITTCDYTLIGEELYAASAYLGREPKQLGAVKSQDACKGIIMTIITVGLCLWILDAVAGTETLPWLRQLLTMPLTD
ncbi:fibronectin type III domain-containing protein [Candidatus Fermentibacterales bacterium]|nr:fibronectin type III domain-containing protein [Candidatus Fermentibacterales bacterium]